MNCSIDAPCVECENGQLIRRLSEKLGEVAAQRDILLAAASVMLERYLDLANSGDAGFWDPESEDAVKQTRAAIAQVSK